MCKYTKLDNLLNTIYGIHKIVKGARDLLITPEHEIAVQCLQPKPSIQNTYGHIQSLRVSFLNYKRSLIH